MGWLYAIRDGAAAWRLLFFIVMLADDRPDVADDEADAADQAGADRARFELVGQLVGRRRERGGARGAAGGRRLPPRAETVREARRARPEGHPPARAAGHRQDAAREGGCERVRREVLRRERVVVRRDVRLLGAARIRRLFKEARRNAPAILFIDELDAVGAARTGHGFNREQDQTLNQLLVELDGFTSADQIVVMGASNRLGDLDPALLRPGRFDRQVLVGPPDLNGREDILRLHTRGKPLAANVDLGTIARRTAASPAPTWRTSPTRPRSSPAAARRSTSR